MLDYRRLLDGDESAAEPGAADVPAATPPGLGELEQDAQSRVVRFIITSTLGGGVAPTAIIALYADLAGDEQAIRYVDQRFTLKYVPLDWREVEDRVTDLADTAWGRGVDLAAAWQRANNVAMPSADPLEQLARLAGVASLPSRPARSIFDDPDDLDELDVDDETTYYAPLSGRLPDLADLSVDAQGRLRRFAIEERLEHGLAPVELLDLYRGFELAGDARSRQYLDRVFVDREPPADWLGLQAEAGRVMDLAGYRGRDAGRMYADVLRASPGIDPLVALRLLCERLELGIG